VNTASLSQGRKYRLPPAPGAGEAVDENDRLTLADDPVHGPSLVDQDLPRLHADKCRSRTRGRSRDTTCSAPTSARIVDVSMDEPTPLAPGTRAPHFALPSTPDQKLSLSDLRGRPVVLVFYPEDWSPVCSDQLTLYQELLPEFRDLDAELVGVSVDGIWSHLAFAENRNLHFPLLADFEPKGEIARAYGVYRSSDGTSERALFVIDGDGIVRWSYVSPVGINPGADGILHALEDLAKEKAS
jgi:peroxiredoxin